MKGIKNVIVLIGLSFFAISSFGQGTNIGDLFLEPNFFDNIKDASAKADEVIYLDLSMQSPKLTQTPNESYEFSNMKMMDLSFNRIASVEDGIGNLKNLEVLNLEGNQYLTSISDEIGKCESLKELNIKTTGIKGEKLAKVKSLVPKDCKVIH